MAERVDVVSEDGVPTGETTEREKAQQEGTWHQTAHLWVYTPQGETLLQRRSTTKRLWPGKLDIAIAGQVKAGESASQACAREAEEELGLSFSEQSLEFVKRRRTTLTPEAGGTDNEVNEIFILRYEGPRDGFGPRSDEVEEAFLIGLDELERRLEKDEGAFAHSRDYWEDMIQEIRKRSG